MASEMGPWVRLDWCPTCCGFTEQSRWLSGASGTRELRVRCNQCQRAVPALGEQSLTQCAANPA